MSERLLDHHPGVLGQPGGAEPPDDRRRTARAGSRGRRPAGRRRRARRRGGRRCRRRCSRRRCRRGARRGGRPPPGRGPRPRASIAARARRRSSSSSQSSIATPIDPAAELVAVLEPVEGLEGHLPRQVAGDPEDRPGSSVRVAESRRAAYSATPARGRRPRRDRLASAMQLGMVGLGRMGANIVRRLMRDGHECVVYDVNPDAVDGARGGGRDRRRRRSTTSSPKLEPPRAVWVMVPAGEITETTVAELAERARARRRDHRRRQLLLPRRHPPRRRARRSGGSTTSTAGPVGGVFGLERGYCLMIGGPRARSSASTRSSRRSRRASRRRERTPGRDGRPGDGRARLPALRAERRRPLREDGPQRDRVRDHGRLRRGPQHPRATPTPASDQREADAETAPLDDPEYYQLRHRRARGRRGLAARQRDRLLAARPDRHGAARLADLDEFEGRVSDSGEGRWTSIAAIDEGVPAPVLTTRALLALRLARPRRLRRQGALGDAQAVRRPRREAAVGRDAVRVEVLEDAEDAAAARRASWSPAAGPRGDRRRRLLRGRGQRRPRPVGMFELLGERSAATGTRSGCSRSTSGWRRPATPTAT